MDEDNNVTTRLLTLLNVSALKSSKRKNTEDEPSNPRDKLNRRRTVQFSNVEAFPTDQKENGVIAIDSMEQDEVMQLSEEEAIDDFQGV
jgi:U3 small nucleolar RNA-associated protein 25